jgi:predicted pyridoxine 5'-phosphate oxidase superfamily flavin-nucleotide-binding protein
VSNVDSNLNKNIQHITDHHVGNRDQATVAIVYNEVTAKFLASQVINTAGAIRNVTQNETLNLALVGGAKGLHKVRKQSGVHKQSFRELQRNFVDRAFTSLIDLKDGLMNFVVVV